jgi:hypothetical protein
VGHAAIQLGLWQRNSMLTRPVWAVVNFPGVLAGFSHPITIAVDVHIYSTLPYQSFVEVTLVSFRVCYCK